MMHVQVKVVCAPHPREEIEAALRAAGERLALTADSISVQMDPTEPRIAVLEFEMHRASQYKVVDDIYGTVKQWAWEFYEDITIRFPKG
jgi:5'-3' exonuclease